MGTRSSIEEEDDGEDDEAADAARPLPTAAERRAQLERFVNAKYEGPQYHGETALHFAVMHRDAVLVRRLVEAGADVDAHADGLFFYERASTYFGGRAVGLAEL